MMTERLYWEQCPICGAMGRIDEEQKGGAVSIICSECGHHYTKAAMLV